MVAVLAAGVISQMRLQHDFPAGLCSETATSMKRGSTLILTVEKKTMGTCLGVGCQQLR
jgi:hypothetical protein